MLILAILAMTTPPSHAETAIFVGTYTGADGGKGIYKVALDPATGRLGNPELAVEATAPSYLCLSPDGTRLYAINEFSDGEASAYAVQGSSLKKLNTVKVDAKGPCHIALDSTAKWAVVSGYGGGKVAVLPILPGGELGPVADSFKSEGSGPNAKRQEAPHLHFAGFLGNSIYVCDLGTDRVVRLVFNATSGVVALDAKGSGKTEPGMGPRHFVASSDAKHIYANNEMGLSVSVFSRDGDGVLTLVQTISTLPDTESQPGWSTAAIKRHPKLPILYVSNRGHNSISAFEILESGNLAFKWVQKLDLSEPRDFAIDPTGAWLVAAGEKSGELRSFKIEPSSGAIEATPHRAVLPRPVCVVFAPN